MSVRVVIVERKWSISLIPFLVRFRRAQMMLQTSSTAAKNYRIVYRNALEPETALRTVTLLGLCA